MDALIVKAAARNFMSLTVNYKQQHAQQYCPS